MTNECLETTRRAELIDAWLTEHQATYDALDEDELRALAEDAAVSYVPPQRERSAARTSPSTRAR